MMIRYILLIFISSLMITTGCGGKYGNYPVNFELMERKNIKQLGISLLLPPEAEVQPFRGTYSESSLERNEAIIRLHTCYNGNWVEWQRYFNLKIEVWDKVTFKNRIENRSKYTDCCNDFVEAEFPEYDDDETKKIYNDVIYYDSYDRIRFSKDFCIDEEFCIIAIGDYDKRFDYKDSYFVDIQGVAKIINSIEKFK